MKSNPKTTFVGILIGVALLGAIIAVLMKVATLKEAGEFLSIAVAGFSALGFYLAKDGKSKNDNGTVTVLFIIISAFSFSCKTPKNVTEKIVIKDSIHTEIVYIPHDSIVYLKGDSIVAYRDVPCDDFKEKTFDNGKVKGSVKVENGKLEYKCKCPDLEAKITWYEKLYKQYQLHSSDSVKVQTIVVYKTPGIVKVFAWIGLGYVLLTIIIIILKIKKIKIPFLWP